MALSPIQDGVLGRLPLFMLGNLWMLRKRLQLCGA